MRAAYNFLRSLPCTSTEEIRLWLGLELPSALTDKPARRPPDTKNLLWLLPLADPSELLEVE